jgi:DNA-binding protein HU-beta
MNKTELAQALSKKKCCELSVSKLNCIIDCLLETISKKKKKNDTVQLIGFGSFSVKKRKARTGRNPQTGESIKIPASKAVKFSVGKALKLKVNKK